jgi:hypothetical protein
MLDGIATGVVPVGRAASAVLAGTFTSFIGVRMAVNAISLLGSSAASGVVVVNCRVPADGIMFELDPLAGEF